MVTKYGFSKNIGMINYADEDEVFIGRDFGHTSRGYSEDVAKKIDTEVKSIMDECYAKAKNILEEHMEILHKCAKLLLEKERIDRFEFESLFAPHVIEDKAEKEHIEGIKAENTESSGDSDNV